MAEHEHINFHVGDSDLRFLGFMAALAARYEMIRKGSQLGGLTGFAGSAVEAVAMLKDGIEWSEAVPLDDVPELSITIHGEREAVLRWREWVRELESDYEDDEDWDDEDEDTAGEGREAAGE